MRWSVGFEAEMGDDRVLRLDEAVELADAVAVRSGIASGAGTSRYGARLIVEATTREEALDQGRRAFAEAARRAGLPESPIVREEVVGEDEEDPET